MCNNMQKERLIFSFTLQHLLTSWIFCYLENFFVSFPFSMMFFLRHDHFLSDPSLYICSTPTTSLIGCNYSLTVQTINILWDFWPCLFSCGFSPQAITTLDCLSHVRWLTGGDFICCHLWRHITTPSSTQVIMYYNNLVLDRSLIRMLAMLLIYGYVPCLKYNWLEPSKYLLLFNMIYLGKHVWSSSITILVIFYISLKLYFTDQDIYESTYTCTK